MSAKIVVTLVKSTIGKPTKHCKIVSGLGLKKLNQPVVHNDTPEIRGMISKISHLLHVAN